MPQQPEEPFPRITAAMLRSADTMCARRLHKQYGDVRGNRKANARFAVSNRIFEDARIAHSELRRPAATDFPPPTDLLPEQQHLYRAAARGYLAHFGACAARAVEIDAWHTDVEELEVTLVGNVGLVVEDADGRVEVRATRIGARSAADLADVVTMRFALLRLSGWLAERPRPLAEFVACDLLGDMREQATLDPADATAALGWLAERVAVVRERITAARPRAGSDCLGCAYIAGCPPHLGS